MSATATRYRRPASRSAGRCVAREQGADYGLGLEQPTVESVLAKFAAAREELAALDLDGCDREELCELLAGMVNEQTALAAAESRVIPTFDKKAAHRHDACVTTASWLRWKVGLGYGDAHRRWKRARLLRRMPLMTAAFEAADVSTAHVDAAVHHATPARLERIAEHDATLTQLARDKEPREVRVAVQRIVELLDPDGSEDPPVCETEDLREVTLLGGGFSKLGQLGGSTTTELTELMLRARDLYSTPDPVDTPEHQQRTPGQKFHDALRDALLVSIQNHPNSEIDGVRAHFIVLADLYNLLGDDERATITPRLGASGAIDGETARHLMATTIPTLRMVLSLGPWMPVSVGRARRVLPPWLRGASQLVHAKCAGPGCDRLFAWCDADHRVDWADGGRTSLFNDNPLCRAHHSLKHDDGWLITFDIHTGVITWTSPDGKRRIDIGPDDP